LGSKRFENFELIQILFVRKFFFQHSSTKVFWTGPKDDYAAHYVVCKYGLRGSFRAAHDKPEASYYGFKRMKEEQGLLSSKKKMIAAGIELVTSR
jgi:hypothetical protein